jgi:hypothetical protein
MTIFAGGVHALENQLAVPFGGEQESLADMELATGSEENLIISLNGGADSKEKVEPATESPKEIVLPEFIGMMLDTVEKKLQQLGVVTSVIDIVGSEEPQGQVIGQKPPAGSKVSPEEVVELVVSDGPARNIVPDLIGQPKESAILSINKAGLMIGRITEKSDDNIAPGSVIGQAPISGTKLETDGTVDLIISSQPQNGNIPLSNKTFQKSGKGTPISLKWKNKKLGEILKELQASSGIKFKAPSSVKSESVTTQVYAATWSDAVRKLLKQYSTMEVSNSEGDLVKVWIISSAGAGKTGAGRSINGRKSGRNKTSGGSDASNLSRMKKKLKLSRSVSKKLYTKLKEIKSWPADKKLPSSMYRDSDLKDFFSLNGIESKKDLNDISKINRIRRAARKQMLIMKKRARASDIELE